MTAFATHTYYNGVATAMPLMRAYVEYRTRQIGRLLLQIGICVLLGFVFVATATANVGLLQFGHSTPNSSLVAKSQRTGTPTPTSRVLPSQTRSPGFSSVPRSVIGQTSVDAYTLALYHFDAPNGNVAIDATGNYTGTMHGNAAVTTTGLYAGVLTLDGNGSYVRTGKLGDLSQGTVEAFVDFQSACYDSIGNPTVSGNFAIVSAVDESSGQTVLYMGTNSANATLNTAGLIFWIYANGQWHMADSGINPCRYLNGPNPAAGPMWPYETWRFHHVAATWGPRGMEIWVDGVLHGVGTNDPGARTNYDYMCNPQMQMGWPPPYPTNDRYPVCKTPVMAPLMTPTYPQGDYTGPLPPYTTFRIGCDSSSACFKGRIDEVRISNVQRTFEYTVVPTVTPTPTQTPDRIMGEYAVDSATLGLYHLNSTNNYGGVYNEASQQWDGGLKGNASITQDGRYNAAIAIDGNLSYVSAPDFGNPGGGVVEAWIKPDRASVPFAVISMGAEPGSSPPWRTLFLGVDTPVQGTVGFALTNGDDWHWVDSGVSVQSLLGCWHHIAGTWGSRGLEIWVDGLLRGVSGYTGRPTFGARAFFGCDGAGRCFPGKLDEIRISSVQRSFSPRALSSREGSGARLPALDGTRYYLPLIQVAPTPAATPTPVCLFGY